MAISIANLLQGVPGGQSSISVAQPNPTPNLTVSRTPSGAGVAQVNLQGNPIPAQGQKINLQGSSPVLQNAGVNLSGTSNPNLLDPNSIIHTPAPTVAPATTTTQTTVAAPGNPNATAATPVVDKSLDIGQNQAALDSSDAQLAGGLGSIRDSVAKLLSAYKGEADQANSAYETNSTTNKTNYLKNQQSALLNASQGRSGLFSVLASLGALNGSGIDLANNAVQKGANDDISGANNLFATDQGNLDTSIGQFNANEKTREQQAKDEQDAAEKALTSNIAQSKQGYLRNISSDYADEGNKEKASTFAEMAKALFPQITAANVTAGIPAYTPTNYSVPALGKYINGGTTVSTAPVADNTGGLPGLLASLFPGKKVTTSA